MSKYSSRLPLDIRGRRRGRPTTVESSRLPLDIRGRRRLKRPFRRVRQPWRWLPFRVRLAIARVRRLFVRRNVVRRAIVALVLVAAGSIMLGVLAEGRALRDAWGPSIRVVTIRSNHQPGEPVEPSDFVETSLPAALVVEDALRVRPTATDVAVRALRTGDVITERDLRSMRSSFEVPSGHRAVSLPTDPTVPSLSSGDVVDLYVVFDRFGGLEAETIHIEPPSIVVDATADSVMLAVHEDHVEKVVSGASTGHVILALR